MPMIHDANMERLGAIDQLPCGRVKRINMTTPVDDSVARLTTELSPFDSRNVSMPVSKNGHLLMWVDKMARLMQPAAIHWVDGSREEYNSLCSQMVERGSFIKLNEELWPGCYYARWTPATSPGSKTAPLSARSQGKRRAPLTTGKIRSRCAAR